MKNFVVVMLTLLSLSASAQKLVVDKRDPETGKLDRKTDAFKINKEFLVKGQCMLIYESIDSCSMCILTREEKFTAVEVGKPVVVKFKSGKELTFKNLVKNPAREVEVNNGKPVYSLRTTIGVSKKMMDKMLADGIAKIFVTHNQGVSEFEMDVVTNGTLKRGAELIYQK